MADHKINNERQALHGGGEPRLLRAAQARRVSANPLRLPLAPLGHAQARPSNKLPRCAAL